MVATEERKMNARKGAVKAEEESHQKQTHPNEKEAKNKIVRESKSAGKVDPEEAEETERKNQEKQNEKEGSAKKSASAGESKVKDRN